VTAATAATLASVQVTGTLPGRITTIGTLSGGAGSWGACRRWIDTRGPEGLVLLFTNVGGDGTNPFVGEDEDTLRFLYDAAADLGAPFVDIRDGRDIWDVFWARKWLGNNNLAHCSWELKTGPARAWMEAYAPDAERVIVGIDSTEVHRLDGIARPRLWKPQLLEMLRERDIRPSRMYELGFAHSNCPACVKAGIGHWIRLLRVWPERYAYAERREAEFRAKFGDVAILRDRNDKQMRPMPLSVLRERVERGDAADDALFGFDPFVLLEEGGCACFT
jgi:hypothetical protein